MARHPITTSYVVPYKSDGVLQTESAASFGRGSYTLLAGATYLFPLSGQDTPVVGAHLMWSSPTIITSATIEDCSFPDDGAKDWSTTAGHWIPETPTTAYVGVVGAGASATNGVLAVTGGAQGGAHWHISDTGARRTRLCVVVGGTGGDVRLSQWAKE